MATIIVFPTLDERTRPLADCEWQIADQACTEAARLLEYAPRTRAIKSMMRMALTSPVAVERSCAAEWLWVNCGVAAPGL